LLVIYFSFDFGQLTNALPTHATPNHDEYRPWMSKYGIANFSQKIMGLIMFYFPIDSS
jgi:hypothetical protein